MANLDRGAYDSDHLPDFEVDGMDDDNEKSRLPLLVLIALVVLAAFGGVVWLAYTQGVERGRADAPPRIIVAQSRPTKPKTAPSPYAGLNIYQPSTPSTPDSEDSDTVPPPPAPLAATHPANAPPALRPSASAKQETPPPPPPQSMESAPQPSSPPVQQQAAPPAPKKVTPVEAPPVPSPTVVKTQSPPHAIKSGSVLLQIGSYKSDSEAMHSWSAFKVRHAAAADYSPDIQRVDLGAKGIWYRLRLGAFTDKKAAVAVCEKLRAQGASCLVAR